MRKCLSTKAGQVQLVRERAVLEGVRRQFMQDKSKRQSGTRADLDIRSIHAELAGMAVDMKVDRFLDDRSHRGALADASEQQFCARPRTPSRFPMANLASSISSARRTDWLTMP